MKLGHSKSIALFTSLVLFGSLLQIHDILVRIRILGSVTLTNGSRCGQKICGFGTLVRLHHSSKMKSHKEVTHSRNQGFPYYFLMMMEGSGAGSALVTDGSWMRIREAQKHPDPQHWFVLKYQR